MVATQEQSTPLRQRPRTVSPNKNGGMVLVLAVVVFVCIMAVGSKVFGFTDDSEPAQALPSASAVSGNDVGEEAVVPEPNNNAPLLPPPADACVKVWCGKDLAYASIIVDAGRRDAKLPKRAWIIGVATAMQESSLKNQANNAVPESLNFPHDKVGADHDSIGLFQQRPPWGTPEQLMDPRTAAKKFYSALKRVIDERGWQDIWQDPNKLELWELAQAVQKSGYPREYQKREADAIAVVDFVLRFYPGSKANNGGSAASAAGPPANMIVEDSAREAAKRRTTGTVMFQCKNLQSAECWQMPWQLVQPVVDNRLALARYFPDMRYMGDLGNKAHQDDDPPQDHTPGGESCADNVCNKQGWIYAQDMGDGGGFDMPRFARWLLDSVRAGKYPEVKYIITTYPGNKGVDGGKYYGLFDRRYGWKQQSASDHDGHVHISYMPGYELAHSNIVADYANWVKGQ